MVEEAALESGSENVNEKGPGTTGETEDVNVIETETERECVTEIEETEADTEDDFTAFMCTWNICFFPGLLCVYKVATFLLKHFNLKSYN